MLLYCWGPNRLESDNIKANRDELAGAHDQEETAGGENSHKQHAPQAPAVHAAPAARGGRSVGPSVGAAWAAVLSDGDRFKKIKKKQNG